MTANLVILYAVVVFTNLLMLLFGSMLYYMPPEEINNTYGYRTKRSMKNQENWNYANKLSGKYMMVSSTVVLVFSLLFLIFGAAHLPYGYLFVVCTGGTMLGPLIVILLVENKLTRFERKTASADQEI